MAFVSDIRALEASLAHRMAAAAKNLAHRINDRRMYRRTVRELQALDARELADLGLSRSMIPAVAHEAVYGKN